MGIWSCLRTHLHGSNVNRMHNPIRLLFIKRVHSKAKWKSNRSAMGISHRFLRLTLPEYCHCFKAKGGWYDLFQCRMFFQGAFIDPIDPGIPIIPAWVQWDCKWPMGISIRCLSIFQHAIFNVRQARSYKRAMFVLRRGYTINNHGCPRREYEFPSTCVSNRISSPSPVKNIESYGISFARYPWGTEYSRTPLWKYRTL